MSGKDKSAELLPCKCNCGYECGRRCGLPLMECMQKHYVKDCEHNFEGMEEVGPGMYSAVCKCGMTAIGHDMRCGV